MDGTGVAVGPAGVRVVFGMDGDAAGGGLILGIDKDLVLVGDGGEHRIAFDRENGKRFGRQIAHESGVVGDAGPGSCQPDPDRLLLLNQTCVWTDRKQRPPWQP